MDPQEEIDALKAAIAGYERDYASATSKDKMILAPLITASRNNLQILLQQQQQQGKVIDFPVTLVQF
jgi:hypothetical protein